MTTTNPVPISESDITTYLKTTFDFSFELSVLEMLRNHNIDCQHGGTYEDPVTKKMRQYDIRALKKVGNFDRIKVSMAIECKKIREEYPIIISSVPRVKAESYHQIAIYDKSSQARARVISIREQYSIYKLNSLVGKDTKQYKRGKDGESSDNDKDMFEKLTQCFNSSNDLISMGFDEINKSKDIHCRTIILPIVVVPNRMLWIAEYHANGERVDTKLTQQCSYFVERPYKFGNNHFNDSMILSHLEIMTFDGLKEFVATSLKDEATISETFFNKGGVEAGLKEITAPKPNYKISNF